MPKPLAILIAVLMALYVVPLGALPAEAAVVGGFEIDGNQTHESAEDWKDLSSSGDGVETSLPDADGKTNRSLTTFLDNTIGGQDDTISGSNNKEDPPGGSQWPNWNWTDNGNATGKSDYGRVASYSYVKDVGGTDHVFLALGFDRGSNVGGNATSNYYFELNQLARTDGNTSNPNPNRSTGDIRITINDQGSGVFSAPVVEKWTSTGPTSGSWGATNANNPQYDVQANSSGSISDLASWWTSVNAPAGTIDKEGFIEATLDLTSFGAILGCPSTGFSTLNGRSSTGASDKNLVDYFKATPINVPSNCASLVINKTDADQQALGGATFKIEPNPLPVGTPGRPDADFITVFDDSDANTAKEGSTTFDDPDATAGRITLSAVVPDIEYTVTEIAPPAGYVGETAGKTVTPEAFGNGSVSFVNTLGSVTFTKQYAGPNDEVPSGASFRLVRDSDGDGDFAEESGADVISVTDNGANDADDTLGEIKVTDLKTGDYKLTETNAPTGWVKDGDAVLFSIPGANNTADVVIPADPTFENPRQTYPLTVRKVAKDDNSVKIDGAVFELYQESGATAGFQKDDDTLVGTCTTGADASDAEGECTVTGLAWGESYYWYEVSVPAPYNLPNDRVVGPITIAADGTTDPAGAAQFEDPQSAIETEATNGALPAGSISDSATLSGVRDDAGGNITFRLYSDNTCSTLVWTSGAFPVDGPGTYGPATTTVATAGDYYWIASYSGDDATGTRAVAGACLDEGETSTVVPAQPGIVTIVDDDEVSLSDGDTFIKDHATLSGATATATGTIEFKVYGPFATDPTGDETVCVSDDLFATVAATTTVSGNGNGNYTSGDVKVSDAGYYVWVASYSGDANNDPAAEECGSADEVVQVKKAEPAVTTDAQQDTVTLGALPTALTDKATLSGATADATGSIQFVLYGPFADAPDADDCNVDKAVAQVSTVESFAGNGTYTSMPIVVTEAGYYTWVATYSGDDNNKVASHACGLAEETTLVNPAAPEITTTAGADQVIGTDGADLTDTATLSGATASATGSITYSLYGPFESDPTGNADACVQGAFVDSVTNANVDGNGSYISPAITVDSTGYYVWVASYSGDANNGDATHACGVASEVVQVTPRQPVITTDVPGPNTLPLGAEGTVLSDTATLSAATTDATGSITFQLYGPFETAPGADDCLPGKALGAPVAATAAVSGNGVYSSATKTVYAAGFYTWIATYNGDANNNSATHACGLADETVEVTKARTSITTDVSDATMELAPTASLVDTATLSGATIDPKATGTISFTLYGPFDTDPEGNTEVCVAGNIAGTAGTTQSVSGPGTYTSEPVVVSEAGWYVWVASYSGDANNQASTHGCGIATEITDVDKAAPTITTQVPASTVRLAPLASLSDTATLSGATVDPAATGTITFSLYGPFESAPDAQSCTESALVDSRVVQVNGNGQYSPVTGITVDTAGFYTWVAAYSGDANNKPASHACGLENETVEVLKSQGAITTDAVDRVKLSDGPTTIADEATLTGVTTDPAATGTIEFKVYGPFAAQPDANSCTVDKLVAGGPYTVAVDGPGTYDSPDVQVKLAGYYVWVASYSGDANNESATHACGLTEETSVVDKASPAIVTQVPAATARLAPTVELTDAATLSGATADPKATGTITFALYGPFDAAPSAQSCTEGKLVGIRVVPVDGNGSYAPADGITVDTAGFYTWVATYSGDANNEGATHACGLANETVEVLKAQGEITTDAVDRVKLSDGPTTIADEATLTGVTTDPAATGTIEFKVYGPFAAQPDADSCTVDKLVAGGPYTVSVDGPGTYDSPDVQVKKAGFYVWVASYSGDANNESATHACGLTEETSVVDKASPTVTTQVPAESARLAPTVDLFDVATLSGATADPKATGTITFRLYGPFASDPGSESCTEGKLVSTSQVAVNGNGNYQSPAATVSVAGFYTWVAEYSGDADNESATHACGLANETVEVLKAQGEITTDAVDRVKLSDGPTTVSDEATLSGVTVDPAATGTIEFKLYGPFAAQPTENSCTEGSLVGGGPYNVEVDGPGTYVSPDVLVKKAGFYVWVASYSGDANNESATHACGLVEETSVVDKATPTVTTQVPAATVALPDASLSDSATLSGATTDPAATGTITFRLYGPFAGAPTAQSCAEGSLVATRVVDVTGNGTYASPSVVVTKAGFYTWVATYSGDANNESATHVCGLANETVEVTKAVTDITTVATSDAIIKLGQKISDSASVTGLTDDASGTVTFNLYGPDNVTCTGTPVFTSTVPLVVTVTESGATGAATSAAYAPTAAGTYRWVASYSGDGNNAVSAGECNDPNEQSVVKAGDNPNLDKFSNPASGSTVQPGSRIDYSVKVWNTGDVAITNADVLDILPPNVMADPASISDGGVLSADGTRITWKVTLAPADANSTADEKTFTYAATVNADAPEGAVLVNTARFLGLEDTTTHVVPTGDLTVVKEVSPVAGGGVVVRFGDTLTYTLTVTASGTLDQPNTVVRDYVPGFDPERPQSGKTTYVAGSASCVGVGTCTVTEPGVDGLISWSLGTVPAGTTRQLTFQVVIDQVAGEPGETVAVDILNAGSVESTRTPRTPSNEVVTPVTEVFPVKESNPPKEEPRVLPRTGSGVPVGDVLTTGAALFLTGLVLLVGTRRRGAHRR